MKFLRFLLREFLLRGVLFAAEGTAALAALYLLSIGAPAASYAAAGRSLLLLVTGSPELSAAHPGHGALEIIGSGAAVTLPLALASLVILTLVALTAASFSACARREEEEHGRRRKAAAGALADLLFSAVSAVPLFVCLWAIGSLYGSRAPFALIALSVVAAGGLGWDAARFLSADMETQRRSTHAWAYAGLGRPEGSLFPLPGTFSGYLLSSSLPRFIPYLAGKVPAIIGAVTVAEIVFSFPGLGSTLLEALLASDTELLVACLFVLLCVNAVVAFIVRLILFIIYPRWYEKAL